MATKTALQTLISTKLPSGVGIPASDHRDVENAFVGEFFPTSVLLVNLVLPVGYRLNVRKSGNNVYINGSLSNYSASIQGSQQVLDISTEVYAPKNQTVRIPYHNGYVVFSNGTISLEGIIGVGQSIFFNGNYQTND